MPYDNSNSGAAWPNDNVNPKAPKWKGKAEVDGSNWEISVWEKTSKAGNPFLRIEFEKPKGRKNNDDDINF